MMISYSEHGSGSGGSVSDYLDKELAEILEGDLKLTQDLINCNTNKLKYRSGIIAFEGAKPSDKIIKDIISEFKRSTFAGLEDEQYNLLLVEHNDTNNYHIHFVIPRLELRTMKSFNPHWHTADQERLLQLQSYLNGKHNLSNPFQEEKRTTLSNINTKCKKDAIKIQINEIVEENIINGNIKNRDDVIKFFEDSGIEVVRKNGTKDITIALDGNRCRLKGAYYGKTFTDIGAVTNEIKRAEREHTVTSSEQLNELKQKLDRFILKKAEYNTTKYNKTKVGINISSSNASNDINSNSSVINTDTKQGNKVGTTPRNEIRTKQKDVHNSSNEEPSIRHKQDTNIHKAEVNDTTRNY